MKKLIFTLLFSFYTLFNFGQRQVLNQINETRRIQNAISFSPFGVSRNVQTFNNTFLANNSVLQLNVNASTLSQIENTKPVFLNLSVPTSEKSNIVLELIPSNIFGSSFKVLNAQNQEVFVPNGVFYKGIIKGDDRSLASISIINGELSGMISTDKGNFNLGKIKNGVDYIFYNDRDLLEKPTFECGVSDADLKKMIGAEIEESVMAPNVACGSVQIYIEADNALFIAKGSTLANANTFVNTVFNQVAVLYDNEGIAITISTTKIWNTIDPYASAANNTSAVLTAFSTQVGNTFNGHLAHLFSTRNLGGGRANLDVLCNKGKGVSGNMDNSTPNVPTFSWNVYVVSHEIGHNFGSPHTQSCSWPVGALDNCYAPEGSCSTGPAPVNGGTIMSYCHVNVGINFANGFGLYPGNLIRNRTQSCLGSAVAPGNPAVLEAYSTSVLLTWTHELDGPFTIEYRIGTGAWTVANSSNKYIQLTSLTPNTTYEWRVKTGCSTYTHSTFATNNTPPIIYCVPTHSTGCANFSIGINDIIIGGLNYSPNSGCSSSPYKFTFSPTRNLTIGQTYSITINQLWIDPISNAVQAAIWVDYNQNGTFEPGEKVFNTTSSYTSSPITGSFTVPANSPLKTNTRMRVILNLNAAPGAPCGTYTFGETEDFYVNITDGILCPQTVDLANPTDNISTGNVVMQAKSTNGTINASNFVTGTGTNVTYQAKSITLTPGFKVDNGTVFLAEIGGCN